MTCYHGEGCGVGKWLEGSSSDKGYWEIHKQKQKRHEFDSEKK